MHPFIDVLRKYFVFSGRRAGRGEFWWFALFYTVVLVFAGHFDLFTGTFNAAVGFGWASGLFVMATLAPTIGVHVRRLHDIGRSGWWVMLALVPLVGAFALLVLTLFDSQPGANVYGACPKSAPAGAGESSSNRSRLTVRLARTAAVLTALGLVAAGGGWYWWLHHGDAFLRMNKAAYEDGRHAGTSRPEPGCLAGALQRHVDESPGSIEASILNSVHLSGCLDASQLEATFCKGVPDDGEILATAAWVNAACTLHGLSDPFCQNLFQTVSRYCASPARTSKVDRGSLPRPLEG